MMNYRVIPVGAYWYWVIYGDTVWYLVVLGHHKLVLFDTWWYRVSIGLLGVVHILRNHG